MPVSRLRILREMLPELHLADIALAQGHPDQELEDEPALKAAGPLCPREAGGLARRDERGTPLGQTGLGDRLQRGQGHPMVAFVMHRRGHLERPAEVGELGLRGVLQDLGHGGNHDRHLAPLDAQGAPHPGRVPAHKRRELRHIKEVVERGGAATDVDVVAQIHPHLDQVAVKRRLPDAHAAARPVLLPGLLDLRGPLRLWEDVADAVVVPIGLRVGVGLQLLTPEGHQIGPHRQQARWQGRREQAVRLRQAQKARGDCCGCCAACTALMVRPCALQRGEVGLQRFRPRGLIAAGGVHGALLRGWRGRGQPPDI